jgi:RNA polymerase sigma-70 factor (ECF subfamily)
LIFREVEDRDLIAKARRGHVDAYNVLVSRWEKRVFNYLLRLVGHREDALDLSQDVFLKAYQNLKKLEEPAKFPGWLFSIAVQSALNRLSDDHREAVLLKVYQGFKFEEMAEILDCPVSTVKSRLYTALDLLKQTLAPVNMGGTQ